MSTNKFDITEDQRDCLQELMNIAYGSATAAISEILDSFATLNIPNIKIIKAEEIKVYLAEQIKVSHPQIVATQLINGKLSGENVFVLDEQSAINMTKVFNEEDEVNDDDVSDVILEITNILSSAATSKLAQLLSTEVSFTSPSIQVIDNIDDFENDFLDDYDQVIIISTQLKFNDFDIQGEMLILTKDESIAWMKNALDVVLEEY